MSWVCEICNANNEDAFTECFVCGEPRSEESIREWEAAEAEARSVRIKAAVYKWLWRTVRWLFVIGTAALVLTTVIAVIIRMVNGNMDELVAGLVVMGTEALERIATVYTRNLQAYPYYITHSPVLELGENFAYFGALFAEHFADLGTFFLYLWQGMLPSIEHAGESLAAIAERIKDAFLSVKDKFAFTAEKISDKFSS